MDNFIKIFGRNFIYGGLILGFALTLIDFIKNSSNNIALYAFLSGSFFILNLFQYYYVNKLSKQSMEPFLLYSIAGGIFWVIYAVLLYYLHKFTNDIKFSIIITLILIIIVSLIYYLLLKN
tara:strand:- start:4439 stop:4801 length:363 start_codon:yes stop_codon:yes gene_type:complete